jgi:preprotein translocase subunit YajC
MIATHALVLALIQPAAGGAPGGLASLLNSPVVPLIGIMVLFYVMILMPQQKRAKEHAARVAAVKRGDTVVLSSGLMGKVVRVEDQEVGLEIAQNVTVKVVKAMLHEVRTRGEVPPANDAKS